MFFQGGLMIPPKTPDCDPRCAASLAVTPVTKKSEICYVCEQKARENAAPSRAISIQPSGKKKRAMTNYR